MTRRDFAKASAALLASRRGNGQILTPIIGGGASIPLNGLIGRFEGLRLSGSQGAAIGTFSDTSGTGNNLTQSTGANKPTLNPAANTVAGISPALFFPQIYTGANTSLLFPSAMSLSTHAFSVLVITEITQNAATANELVSFQTGGDLEVYINTDPRVITKVGSVTSSTYVPWGPQLWGCIGGASNAWTVLGNSLTSRTALTTSTVSNGVLMAYANGSAYCLNANVLAVFVYNRALAQTDVNQVWAYARTRYRCLPFTTTRLISVCGDSQSNGYPGSAYNGLTWPQQWLQAHPTDTLYNFALTGTTTAGLVSPDPVYSSSPTKKICVIYSGANDGISDSTGAWIATALTNIQNFVAARRATGWKCVTCTTGYKTLGVTNPNFLSQLTTFDNDLLVNSGGVYGDAIANIASDPNIGLAGTPSNVTYFEDGAHYTKLGMSIALNSYIGPAILSL